MAYCPDYPPGTHTPHGAIFDRLMTAAHIGRTAVADAIPECEALLGTLPDRQIAYELTRLHQMLGRFGGKGVVEDLMYRFCDRRPVVRVLRATFGGLEPALSDRLKDEAERPGRHRQWPDTSRVRTQGTQKM